MVKNLLVGIILLGLISPTFSQVPENKSSDTPQPNLPISTNTVDGLALPPDQTVRNDEGFVTIQAKCAGEVKWLVISGLKIKYFTMPQNSIVVSIPPQGGLVTVFAVGLVNGKLTEFARTNINVTPPTSIDPGPGPVSGPYHVSFIVDLKNISPELAVILNSQKIVDAVTSRNGYYRRFDIQDPNSMDTLKKKGLNAVLQQEGGAPLIIIQNKDGSIAVKPIKIPKTETEVLQFINSILK